MCLIRCAKTYTWTAQIIYNNDLLSSAHKFWKNKEYKIENKNLMKSDSKIGNYIANKFESEYTFFIKIIELSPGTVYLTLINRN